MTSRCLVGGVAFLFSVLVSFPLSADSVAVAYEGKVPEMAGQSDLVVKG